MNENPSLSHYGAAVRWLHWLSVLAIATAFVAMEIREDMPKTNEWRPFVTQLHFWAGLSVLAMLLFRLWLYGARPKPPIVPAPGRLTVLAAKATHLALYAAMLVQPLLGLATAGADGKIVIVPLFGFALPPVLAANERLAERLEELHESLGEALLILIGLHVTAALWHHFWLRDNTLKRMWSGTVAGS